MSSFSTSFIPPYTETPILDNIAQIATQLGEQQYGWAQQQFASNSALTDQVVNNFLSASQKDMDLANNMTNRYENEFQPQEDALVRDANTYSSDARVRSEMGRAESDTAQSMDAAKGNLERSLQSYGIDPSSGRYAELEHAQDAQRAAAQAQAGQAARYNTEATGRQLRANAIQVGQQYPGQIVNSLNNAMQGFAGAENAKLSNTNTGVNAFDSADKFFNTGMALKYPPLGNTSTKGTILNTTAQNGNNGSNGSSRPGQSGGGGGNPFGGGGTFGSQGGGGGNGSNGNNGGNFGGGGNNGSGTIARIINTGYDDTGFGDNGMTTYGPDFTGNSAQGNIYQGGQTDPFGDFYGNGNTGGQDFGDYGSQGGGNGWDVGSDPVSEFNTGSLADTGGFGDSGPDQNYNDSFSGSSAFDQPSQDYFGNSYDTSGGSDAGNSGDYSFDPSQSYDSGGGDYGGGDDFAAGGAIPENGPTTGGFVPPQASPSGGAQTDDVNAHVNVGEFVIPRDVAMWKGQEFFQKLIQQSRKNRQGAPAKGKPSSRPTDGPPSFVSQGA